MKQLGTPAFTGKHIQAVARKLGSSPVIAKEFLWPLDVGGRTANQIAALAPWLSKGTILSRLKNGERKLNRLIARPKNRCESARTDRQKAAWSETLRKRKCHKVIAKERRDYQAKQSSFHPQIEDKK